MFGVDLKIISGTSNRSLANLIARNLNKNLVLCDIKKFSNGEVNVKIKESIRNENIVIIQTVNCSCNSVNDILVETLILVDACKRSDPKSITLVYACLPYSRQDKKNKARAPISASMVCKIMQTAGVTRMVSMDLHTEQIQGMFDGPFDNLYSTFDMIKYLKSPSFSASSDGAIVISPDSGGVARAKFLAEQLHLPFAMMAKRRDYNNEGCIEEITLVGPSIVNKKVIIVDDIADTCGTVCAAAKVLVEKGSSGIYVIVTHGILSGPARERLLDSENIKKIIVTNTIELSEIIKTELKDKLTVIDVSNTFSNALRAIHMPGYELTEHYSEYYSQSLCTPHV